MTPWPVPALTVLLANPVLLDPAGEAFTEKAPDHFRVRIATTKGEIFVAVHRDWSPLGVDRFHQLVKHGFYDDSAFFRVIDGAWAQFGIHGDPEVAPIWRTATIPDEPVRESNLRGRVTYAHGFESDDRTTQLFINLRDNAGLDEQGFPPIGEVIAGMDVADALYAEYGETAGGGIRRGHQDPIFEGGNAYLRSRYPELDYIQEASLLP